MKKIFIKLLPIYLALALPSLLQAQVNYVNNPGFEMRCGSDSVYYWTGNDSVNCNYHRIYSSCSQIFTSPLNLWTYQYPHSGESYVIGTHIAYNNFDFTSYYIKNRLKFPLIKNSTYCVRYYLNIGNNSTDAFDAFDVYFGNAPDTLAGKLLCMQPITFLPPQISNTFNNIISDTLNWTAMTGTFTASGGEKFLLFGNLRGTNISTLSIYTNTSSPHVQDICLDDFSVVDIDLPADAGPDKRFFAGDSVYIGRPLDVGTDYACTWYQLPFTGIPMPGMSGMWVKPIQTSTYVVAQQLWCSGIKYDTVVVYKDAVGIKDLEVYVQNIQLFPNPVASQLDIKFTQQSIGSSIKQVLVVNNLGQRLDVPINALPDERLQIECSSLAAGVYYLRFEIESGGSFVKKFVVER